MVENKIKKLMIKTADDKSYTLAYDRNACARISRKGFRIEDVKNNPAVALPLLISGAFLKFHPELTQEQIDEIWSKVKGKEELLHILMEMYATPINALLDEPEDDGKNSTWEVIE